jgi:hypothetical protein
MGESLIMSAFPCLSGLGQGDYAQQADSMCIHTHMCM